MPLSHTASKDPGDFAADGPYTHAKIVKYMMDLENNRMVVFIKHGTMDGATFVPGAITKAEPQLYVIQDIPAVMGPGENEGDPDVELTPADNRYTDLIANNQSIYDGAKNAIYNELIAKHGFAGVVV